jgi:prevent-host-death family protein
MQTVNLRDAESQLSILIESVMQGHEIVILKDGKPIAELVPVQQKPVRIPGRLKGQIRIADDFDAPLPAGFMAGFEDQ